MSIVKMKRLRLLGLTEERDDLLNALLPLGCVEVTDTAPYLSDPEYTQLLKRDVTNLSEYRNISLKLSSALEKLKKYASLKSALFIIRKQMTESEFFSQKLWNSAIKDAEAINALDSAISKLHSEKSKLESALEFFVPWNGLDIPLDIDGTRDAAVIFGTIPGSTELSAAEVALENAVPMSQLFHSFSDKSLHYFAVICHRSVHDEAIDALRPFKFSQVFFKSASGSAADSILKIRERIDAINAELSEKHAAIVAYAPSREDLEICLDRSIQEIARETAKEKLISTGNVFALEGWVAETGEKQLTELLSSRTCAWELSEPEDSEEPPILLKNNSAVSAMNMVTEMYSLPAYRGIDPNPLMFFFFVFFFGLMFADMGYGLIMLIACIIIKKKYEPKGGMGNIMKLGILLGISTTVCGALTGGLFGDAIPVITENWFGGRVEPWALISPLEDPMTILIFGIVAGCIHMVFGQLIHIYIGYRDGGVKGCIDASLDVVPWWTLFAGIGLAVLNGSLILLWIGVAFLVLTQGRHNKGIVKKLLGGIKSLYDITSWLGDVLSYARLMALMLATTVIASVVNILGSLPGSIVIFIPIFLFGHIFNLGINIIGTYVHAARLQYLEFFSKFYESGGVPFEPLAYDTKYVDIVNGADRSEEVKKLA